MKLGRFLDLVYSFYELPSGICSEDFNDGEFEEFRSILLDLLNDSYYFFSKFVDSFDEEEDEDNK